MEWSDDGIVLSARGYGENDVILEMFTRAHGRHLGLVRGGASRRKRGQLQPGNSLTLTWRARLSDHLGTYAYEPLKDRAGGLLDDRLALGGLASACAVATAMPEREAHSALYEAFELLADMLAEAEIWPAVYVRWELGLLQELGFALDLSACAASGVREDLIYVSPRTGRAVSRTAGTPYHDRLLPLPGFLLSSQVAEASELDVLDGLRLTGHFLERHFFGPSHGRLPDARYRLVEQLARRAQPVTCG